MCQECKEIAPLAELLEARHMLMLAEKQNGDLPENAIRPMTEAERRAKIRFREIDAMEAAAKAENANSVESLKYALIKELLKEIFEGRNSATIEAATLRLKTLALDLSPKIIEAITRTAEDVTKILEGVYVDSSAMVIAEALRQGAPIGDLEPLPAGAAPEADPRQGGSLFGALAAAAGMLVFGKLTGGLVQWLEVTAGGGKLSLGDLAAKAAAITMAGPRDELSQAVHLARGLGRYDTAEELEPEEIWASELLDGATCAACARVDGKTYPNLAAARVEYERGGYGACYGGGRCRGTLVMIYKGR